MNLVKSVNKYPINSLYNRLIENAFFCNQKLKSIFYSTFYMTKALAFYVPIKNGLSVQLGHFHLPWFSGERAEFMNYGAIGFVIGHEVSF